MSALREAAQQALEALDWIGCSPEGYDQMCADRDRAQEALRTALAQEEQEPVAWRAQNATPPGGFVIFQQYPQALADLGGEIEPLYTHPPRRESQALMKEDIAQNLQSRHDAAKLLEERRQEIVQPRREWQSLSDAWKCSCGANLYIDAHGKPRSKANE